MFLRRKLRIELGMGWLILNMKRSDMKKLEANWGSGAGFSDKAYFCHAIYNPNKPAISLEEAMETGQAQNPTTIFSEKEKLDKADLPEGFELCKLFGKINQPKEGYAE